MKTAYAEDPDSILAEVLEGYHDPGEVIDAARIFGVEFSERAVAHLP